MKLAGLYTILFALLTTAFSQLKFVAEITRHGARGPVFPLFDYDTPYNKFYSGELTPTGMRQHLVLGQQLRQKYIENSDLGLDKLFNPKQIYVQSTAMNRTLTSAISQLQGLYPPGTGPNLTENLNNEFKLPPFKGLEYINQGDQALLNNYMAIPVHSYPLDNDPLLQPNGVCPTFFELMAKNYLAYSPKRVEAEIHYSRALQKLKVALNFSTKITLTMTTPIYDTLICDKFNGQNLQVFNNMTPELWQDLEQMDTLQFVMLYGNVDLYKIGVSRVFQNWISYFDKALQTEEGEAKQEIKLSFYSAHDTNLINFQLALNLTSYECLWQKFTKGQTSSLNCVNRPQFASSVILELYQDENSNQQEIYTEKQEQKEQSNEAYIKILYDGEYMFLCEKAQTSCDYQEFKSRIEYFIYQKQDGVLQPGKLELDQICHTQQGESNLLDQIDDEYFLSQLNHLFNGNISSQNEKQIIQSELKNLRGNQSSQVE